MVVALVREREFYGVLMKSGYNLHIQVGAPLIRQMGLHDRDEVRVVLKKTGRSIPAQRITKWNRHKYYDKEGNPLMKCGLPKINPEAVEEVKVTGVASDPEQVVGRTETVRDFEESPVDMTREIPDPAEEEQDIINAGTGEETKLDINELVGAAPAADEVQDVRNEEEEEIDDFHG